MKKEPSTENLSPLPRRPPLFMALGSLYGPGASRFYPQSQTLGDAGGHALAEDRIYLFTNNGSKKMFFFSGSCVCRKAQDGGAQLPVFYVSNMEGGGSCFTHVWDY